MPTTFSDAKRTKLALFCCLAKPFATRVLAEALHGMQFAGGDLERLAYPMESGAASWWHKIKSNQITTQIEAQASVCLGPAEYANLRLLRARSR